jgi:glycerophosphoryl diester phosphodiesterase
MVPALLRAVRAVRGAEERVRIASFSLRNLARVRASGWKGETGLAPSEVVGALLGRRVAGHAAQVPRRAYGIRFASQTAIHRFHRAGVRVDFWTIDDPTEASALFALGADGVMTDDPRAVVAQKQSTVRGRLFPP